ncbi:MAG: zinc metalloprotease HtpX [Chloroflexi bacterium]|nr:zinc metalloprotease HtpX [Chloroflexota bacterium]
MLANTIKTTLLLTTLTIIFILMGQALGGQQGMILAFGLAIVMNVGAYWFSDSIALKSAGAREVSEQQAPQLFTIVRQLAQKADLPMPRVYLIENPTPNAFATGRNPQHAAVAVTAGILNILSPDELSGVLAHELAHVKHRDTLIATVVATVAGAITLLASMARWAFIFGGYGGGRNSRDQGNPLAGLLMIIVAPIAALLIQMAISRSREFEADSGGAQILGNPLPLASALEKLEAYNKRMPMDIAPSTAHLYIVNPISGEGLRNLFSTHPPIYERVARLKEMGYGKSASSYAR